ncbi:MAG: nitroreductase family protein [Oscillospiraceae bacterium]|nr:nitroreductase family protein [Oscillospiraceae bacterium]
MEKIIDSIRSRRSVRGFDGREPDMATLETLLQSETANPFGIPVSYKLLRADEHGLSCPVVSGTELYIGGRIQKGPRSNEAFGYSFERLILAATAMGLGTVWLGGTMNRDAYERAMELAEGEMMPCATPIGYMAKKMSIKESVMRRAIRADGRQPFETLFFRDDFFTPLTPAEAGALAEPLEMVRLAPSAVNRQPWRVLLREGEVHFYLKRAKAFDGGELDMQRIDMGIALCHFELSARAAGLEPVFSQAAPDINAGELEYIASYRI